MRDIDRALFREFAPIAAVAVAMVGCGQFFGVMADKAKKEEKKATEFTCTASPYTSAKTNFIPNSGPLQVLPPVEPLAVFHVAIFDESDPHAILVEVWSDHIQEGPAGLIDFFWKGDRVMRILPQSGMIYKRLPLDGLRLRGQK